MKSSNPSVVVFALQAVVFLLISANVPSSSAQLLEGEPFPETTGKTPIADFDIDPDDPRKYVSGGHRRPTDPATATEIDAALKLLFGAAPVSSFEEANDLANLEHGWKAIESALAEKVGGVDPININGIRDSKKLVCSSSALSASEAVQHFEELVSDSSFANAYQVFKNDDLKRCNLNWWSVRQTATIVPDREHVISVENAIDRGENDYDLRRIIAVRLQGGVIERVEKDRWQQMISVAVDVTNITAPKVAPEFLETYKRHIGKELPARELDQLDQLYLMTASMALYEKTNTYHIVAYNSNLQNHNGRVPRRPAKMKSRPYAWKHGAKSKVYGDTDDSYISSAQLVPVTKSYLPLDGFQIGGSGNFMGPYPLTMQMEVDEDSNIIPSVENTLRNSDAVGLCWFGRGLSFTEEEASAFLEAIDTNPKTAPFLSDFSSILDIVSTAINRAWKDDEIVRGSGIKPGMLVERNGRSVPKPVVLNPFDTPAFVNHATPTTMKEYDDYRDPVTQVPEPGGLYRDITKNADFMAPPIDDDGEPILEPNGKPAITMHPLGSNFDIDGYSVTYSAGFTWRFLMGFDPDAGLTLYHIRLVLPPTRANPDGEEVPYLFRAAVSEYGTDYSSSNHGMLYSESFFESNFRDATSTASPGPCSGVSLPLFRSRDIMYMGNTNKEETFYSTYFPKELADFQPKDPFMAAFGVDAPIHAFPLDKSSAKNGIIEQAICLEETSYGKSMWHAYTNQQLRGLTISLTAITNAYNIILRYELLSDGKMKVGQHAHGLPALMNFGMQGINGAYSSAGRGGFSSNHLHWAVVALEPNLKGHSNKIIASDWAAPEDEPADWFGQAMYKHTTPIDNICQQAEMKYDYDKQRTWKMASFSEDGEMLGALKVSSPTIGTRVKEGFRPPSKKEDSYARTQWFLSEQDIFVFNATGTRQSSLLLAQPTTADYDTITSHPLLTPQYCPREEGGRITKTSKKSSKMTKSPKERSAKKTKAPRNDPEDKSSYFQSSQISETPTMFLTTKLLHDVHSDELPVQNGFSTIEVQIEPNNLFGFNPNILVRQDKRWLESLFQTEYWDMVGREAYESPYNSEFEDNKGTLQGKTFCTTQ